MPVPDLHTQLTDAITLRSPVIAASGGFGFGDEVADLANASAFAAIISPTITVQPCSGNPMPRTAETAAGLLHSLGNPNPGLSRFISEYLPRMAVLPCATIVSVLGTSVNEWMELASALQQNSGPIAIELNLSSLSREGEAAILASISAAVSTVRRATKLSLIVKLPAANVEVGRAAQQAAAAGADAIAVSQGFPGVAVRLSSRSFRFPGVAGELSGPCIKPLALYQVWRVRESVTLPIIASGGIMTGEDAAEFLIAGANAVAVGIAPSINPDAAATISAQLTDFMSIHGITNVRDLIGAAVR